MSERVFAIRIRELAVASPVSARDGELLVSAETTSSILREIAADVGLFERDGNKLVHPDD